MVTYGPWQEEIEYTETWKYGTTDDGRFGRKTYDISPVPTYNGIPLTRSQWQGAGGMYPINVGGLGGRAAQGRISVGDFTEEGYGTAGPSTQAWSEALVGDPGSDFSHEVSVLEGPSITYDGGISPILPLGTHHVEDWNVTSFEAMPEFHVRTTTNWHAIAGVPITPPAGALYADFDPERNTDALLTKAVSLHLDFDLLADLRWNLFVKEMKADPAGWLLSGGAYNPIFGPPSGDNLGTDGSYDFDISAIEEWKVAADPIAPTAPTVDQMQFGIMWRGGWPGNYLGPATEYPVDPVITFTYKWLGPRWRWVYDTVPYRRTFPRDDALAGGAGRNWPPSKSVQAGRRTSGAII